MNIKKSKPALGIDFGGTSTKVALVSPGGQILEQSRFDTTQATDPASWLAAVLRETEQIGIPVNEAHDRLCGAGIGAPGFVDFLRGFIYELPNVPGWQGIQLRGLLEERLNVPVFIDNDVNAMAAGECRYGIGKEYQHALFCTLGTGVGGALLLHGQIYRGAFSMAGELGHVTIDRHGRASQQGFGGVEQYVGNSRIIEAAREKLAEDDTSALHAQLQAGAELSPRLIAAAAHEGDRLSLDLFDDIADCLAAAFASVVYLLQPQVIIVGGGVSLSGSVLFDPLDRHLKRRLSPVFYDKVDVRQAKLGNEAGMLGAASLALMPT